MDTTIYDIANEILLAVINSSSDFKEKPEEAILRFICGNDTQYEDIIGKYENYVKDSEYLKNIMKLCIIGGSYKCAVYELEHDIHPETAKETIDELEKGNHHKVLASFKEGCNNSRIIDYIVDYIEYILSNYIYANDCIEIILKTGRGSKLLNINPFEISDILDYLDCLIPSERIIGDFYFINLQIIARISLECDLDEDQYEEEISPLYREYFFETVEKLYDEEKLKYFYGYILGCFYENIKTTRFEGFNKAFYQEFIDYFEDDDVDLDKAILRFEEELDFFEEIILYFTEIVDVLEPDDLSLSRKALKEKGGEATLRKFNRFYDIEESFFNGYQKKLNGI